VVSGATAADVAGESGWGNVKRARQQMEGSRLIASQGSVVPALRKGSKLLEEAAKEGSEGVLNLLVVLSDRTRNSWQGAGAGQLKLPEGTEGYWLDVGGEAVPHVAITQLVLDPPAAAPGSQVRVQVELRARGEPPGGKTAVQLSVGMDNDPDVAKPAEKKAVELTTAEPVKVVEFVRQVPLLPEGEKEGMSVGAVSVRDGTIKLTTRQIRMRAMPSRGAAAEGRTRRYRTLRDAAEAKFAREPGRPLALPPGGLPIGDRLAAPTPASAGRATARGR
jgi:hypothetical protein